MKIGLAAPEKPSHLYLENDPSPLLDLHYLRISPWLWFSRRPGMPNAGVITVEEPLDGDHAFGPAARLEAEWRRLLAGGGQMVGQVDHAKAAVRRRELEAAMLGEYHLSLPPETHPLDDVRRRDHVRWRQEALAEARRELAMAQRSRLLRRILTLGLWRK